MKLKLRNTKPQLAPAAKADFGTAGAEPVDHNIFTDGRRLGEILVDSALATRTQVANALAVLADDRTQRLGEILVGAGVISESALARTLADQRQLGVADLRNITPTQEAMDLLPEPMARRLMALPIATDDATVTVAVADPDDELLTELRESFGKNVTVLVAPRSEVLRAIATSYRALAGIDARIEGYEVQDALLKEAAKLSSTPTNEEAPVVHVVQQVFVQALRDRASDIHIEPQADRLRVRFRVDGALHDVIDLPGSMAAAVVSRVKILGGMNIVERRRPLDGQISMEIDRRAVDIRVSTIPTIGGEKVVMRVLDKSRPLYHLRDLGMPDHIEKRYSRVIASPYGMVICAGPTGSGKTTTLYGSLGAISTPELNVMTVEDPVEYTFPSINQIQINDQAGLTFASGLRSILRQDPDVILVGEVRDVETARIAVQAALTGHFVLSSIHATDSVSALHRLLDMGIETFLVASSITAVVAQRLVRRSCSYCLTEYEPTAEELAFLESLGGRPPEKGFFRGAGCNFCSQTGYLERIGVYELLEITDSVRELVLRRAAHEELRQTARSEGMRTLQEEAMRIVETGVTTLPEVMRSIYMTGA